MQDVHQVAISAEQTVRRLWRLLKIVEVDIAKISGSLDPDDPEELDSQAALDQLVLVRADLDLAYEQVIRWQALGEVLCAR